jgi:hypothetical protein
VNTHADIAAMLGALAEWVDDSLAGGDPPKVVARRAAEAARSIAGEAAQAGRGGEDDSWGPVPDDVTVMLRRRPAGLPSGHAGWRAARFARRQVARMRAWISG